MGWKSQKKTPLFFRTISNWFKYRNYMKDYQGNRDDLAHKLLRKTVDQGFNEGVESFDVFERYRAMRARQEKEEELEKLAKMETITLEKMLKEKERMERIVQQQQSYIFDPKWRPSAEEILASDHDIVDEDYVSPRLFYRVYYVHDRLSYVGVSVVPGCRTEICVDDTLFKVNNRLKKIFTHLAEKERANETKVYKVTLNRELKKKNNNVNIDHVKEAMGLDDNKKKDDKRLDDLFDDLF